MNQKWMRRALIGVLVASGVAAGTAPVASADYDPDKCPVNEPCLYHGPKGTGTKSIQRVLVAIPGPLHIANLARSHFIDGSVVDNRISSIWNRTGWCMLVFSDPNFTGTKVKLDPNGMHEFQAVISSGGIIRDDISSIQMDPNCTG
jgi:Peptidase inhibitor family I36